MRITSRELAGRDPQLRVVNLDLEPGHQLGPGAMVAVRIVEATPHSLLAEPIEAAPGQARVQPAASGERDFAGSAVKSGARDADDQRSVDRAGGEAEDALRVL